MNYRKIETSISPKDCPAAFSKGAVLSSITLTPSDLQMRKQPKWFLTAISNLCPTFFTAPLSSPKHSGFKAYVFRLFHLLPFLVVYKRLQVAFPA
jgi:hypothetical protein